MFMQIFERGEIYRNTTPLWSRKVDDAWCLGLDEDPTGIGIKITWHDYLTRQWCNDNSTVNRDLEDLFKNRDERLEQDTDN